MSALVGPLATIALVLAVGGLSKWRQPEPTVTSFRLIGLPASALAVRLLATVEVLVGVATLVVGGRALAAVTAALFLGFTAASAALLRLGDQAASCGCFGARSAPPSIIHVMVDGIAAAVAAAAALVDVPGLRGAGGLPGGPWVLLGLAALGAALTVALLTALADTLDAARRGPRPIVPTFEVRG